MVYFKIIFIFSNKFADFLQKWLVLLDVPLLTIGRKYDGADLRMLAPTVAFDDRTESFSGGVSVQRVAGIQGERSVNAFITMFKKPWVNRLLSMLPRCVDAPVSDTERRGCRVVTVCPLLAESCLSRRATSGR